MGAWIARFMGPTRGPPGADRPQVGPRWATWTLLSGFLDSSPTNGCPASCCHYNNVIMGAIASQITSLTIIYSTDYSGADQRKHKSSALLAFVGGIQRGQVNSMLGHQNAQLLSERPIHEKRNVQLTIFWSKWRKKQLGVLVWCWITNIYWGIYGDNHGHGTRKHFGKGLVTGRQDSRHTVFLVVCTANATSSYRHIC